MVLKSWRVINILLLLSLIFIMAYNVWDCFCSAYAYLCAFYVCYGELLLSLLQEARAK